MIEVRREPPDAPAARGLWAQYMDDIRGRIGPDFTPTEEIFATEGAFDGPGSAWLVLYEDGEPVACGGLRRLADATSEIKRMFVAPAARGRGHARRLLAALEELARADGARRIRLISTSVLTEARALYESAGYVEISRERVEERDDYWMEKAL